MLIRFPKRCFDASSVGFDSFREEDHDAIFDVMEQGALWFLHLYTCGHTDQENVFFVVVCCLIFVYLLIFTLFEFRKRILTDTLIKKEYKKT